MKIKAYSPQYLNDLNRIRTCEAVYPNLLSMPYESEAETAAYFEGKNKYNTIAIVDGKAVAYAQLRLEKNVRKRHKAQLSIAVHSDHYRKKIGFQLMDELIKTAKYWLNIRKIELTVLKSNTSAIKLYEKFGFEVEGEFKQDTYVNGKYEDVYYMSLLLRNEDNHDN